MRATDKKRLKCMENYCRDIYFYMQRGGETYDGFAADAAYRKIVFERLHHLSELSCGLSPEASDALEKHGFRAGYLHSLRFWVQDAESGGERVWRVVWEILSRDCVPLLLLCTRLGEES